MPLPSQRCDAEQKGSILQPALKHIYLGSNPGESHGKFEGEEGHFSSWKVEEDAKGQAAEDSPHVVFVEVSERYQHEDGEVEGQIEERYFVHFVEGHEEFQHKQDDIDYQHHF